MSKEILEIAAELFPNSILGELLANFPMEIVVKFLTIFSGRPIYIPKVETVYRCYRNRTIKEKLSANDTWEVRRYLANFFGITSKHVGAIYSAEKQHGCADIEISESAVERISGSIFCVEVQKARKDLEKYAATKKR